MSTLREVLAVFDIVVNSKQLEDGTRRIDAFIGKLKEVGTALLLVKAIKSMAEFGEHVTEAAREVKFHAGRMEMEVDAYQKLSQVGQEYGMTLENLQIANTLFVRALGNAGGVMGIVGGHSKHAAQAMKSLGLNAAQFKGQKLEEILPTIADAFEKIEDPIEKVTTGLNLFGHRGRSIMPMISQGGAKLRLAFAEAIPVFEKLTIEDAQEAAVAGMRMRRTWDHLVNNTLGRALMNAFTKGALAVTKFVKVIEDLVKISEIGKAVLISFGLVAGAVALALIVAWAPVLVPILAVLAAFAALALIIDDFLVFMQGGDSVIGDFFDAILGEGGAEQAQKFIQELWDTFKGFLEDVKGQAFKEFIENFKKGFQEARDAVLQIKAAIAFIHEKWVAMRDSFDKFGRMLGAGSTEGKAVTTVAGALASPNFQPTIMEAPPMIGPPTAGQAAGGGGSTLGSAVQVPGGGITLIGNIDSGELTNKMRRVMDDHNEMKIGQILRDAGVAVGGGR